jgi:TPR repeat protein
MNAEIVFMRGEGTPPNSSDAVKWLTYGAEEGLAAAQMQLAASYYDGDITGKNLTSALKWFQLAANQKDSSIPPSVEGVPVIVEG